MCMVSFAVWLLPGLVFCQLALRSLANPVLLLGRLGFRSSQFFILCDIFFGIHPTKPAAATGGVASALAHADTTGSTASTGARTTRPKVPTQVAVKKLEKYLSRIEQYSDIGDEDGVLRTTNDAVGLLVRLVHEENGVAMTEEGVSTDTLMSVLSWYIDASLREIQALRKYFKKAVLAAELAEKDLSRVTVVNRYSRDIIELGLEVAENVEGIFEAYGMCKCDSFFLVVCAGTGDIYRYLTEICIATCWVKGANDDAYDYVLKAKSAYDYGIHVGELEKMLRCHPLMLSLFIKMAFLEYDLFDDKEMARKNAAEACRRAYADLAANMHLVDYAADASTLISRLRSVSKMGTNSSSTDQAQGFPEDESSGLSGVLPNVTGVNLSSSHWKSIPFEGIDIDNVGGVLNGGQKKGGDARDKVEREIIDKYRKYETWDSYYDLFVRHGDSEALAGFDASKSVKASVMSKIRFPLTIDMKRYGNHPGISKAYIKAVNSISARVCKALHPEGKAKRPADVDAATGTRTSS